MTNIWLLYQILRKKYKIKCYNCGVSGVNAEKITGYMYESWHLRYVGKDLAKVLYNEGNWITIEEHFGITSKYEG